MKKLLCPCMCAVLLMPSLPAQAQQAADKTPGETPRAEATERSLTPKSPWVAGALSVIPGLGQIYNEEYVVGGIAMGVELGLYFAAAAYSGILDPNKNNTLGYETIFLLALAGGIHLFCIFDATMEAARRNENIERWSVMVDPGGEGFSVAYQFRF
jgi:hypothetical protein